MAKTIIEFEIVRLVKNRRETLKLSQAKIADALQVTPGYIGQVEMKSSASMYSFDNLNELAKYLECSMRDFMPEIPL